MLVLELEREHLIATWILSMLLNHLLNPSLPLRSRLMNDRIDLGIAGTLLSHTEYTERNNILEHDSLVKSFQHLQHEEVIKHVDAKRKRFTFGWDSDWCRNFKMYEVLTIECQ